MYPVLFVAHGSPEVALGGPKAELLNAWGQQLNEPAGILIVSAHWEGESLMLGATDSPELIYDYSFELGRFEYPAPGAPDLAKRVRQLLEPAYGSLSQDTGRGWDHGVWTILLHMFPEATIPILQLSLPRWNFEKLFELGKAFSPLRQEEILIIGSGQLTHDLSGRLTVEEAYAFDRWLVDRLNEEDIDALIRVSHDHPLYLKAHPTDEHYAPFLIALGAAEGSWNALRFPIFGFEYEILSNRSIQWG